MIKMAAAFLRKLARRVWMLAAWLTAIGAMLIPAAMVWALEAPKDFGSFWTQGIALAVGLLGFAFVVFGLVKSISDDRTAREIAREKAKAEVGERRLEGLRRQDEHQEYITTLREIARKLGVNTIVLKHKIRKNKSEVRGTKGEDNLDE